MAAADISLDNMFATVESDDSVHLITISDSAVHLTNKGTKSIFLSMVGDPTIPVDGLQYDGIVELEPGDSIPLPSNTRKVQHTCKPGESSKMWYIPVQS